ncbi:short chain dehydrogenase/reductase [Chloropicon primus]|uniref:Short chain dehydrogenase/reductase n=1 Tax=Chloropicon primus TaxID=1764295 RepID=A0A5B8MXE2_9CHLO|nr:short chain dehydrogenase/reductase [Chloropicon primus]UPR04474.1 short chain dehydrogenase/reductase [Chloropicon primus]|eukprot:QDZ25269.1 short chain dehydrogenase/reductase [Chloropicon primus]
MKTVLVTGATQGIGLHTAMRLAQTGHHHVVLHARSTSSGSKALEECAGVKGARRENLSLVTGDLSDLSQVKGLADQVKESVDGLDVLINNAGVFAQEERQVSHDGFELTYATNVLAPYLLTRLLLPRMKENGHIITTASLSASGRVPWDDLQLERGSYSNHKAYSLSKLLDIMFTFSLHRKLPGMGYPTLKTNTLDPGTVDTRMLRQGWAMRGVPLSTADNTFKLATEQAPTGISKSLTSGKYYVDNKIYSPPEAARPPESQDRLWDILEEQCRAYL